MAARRTSAGLILLLTLICEACSSNPPSLPTTESRSPDTTPTTVLTTSAPTDTTPATQGPEPRAITDGYLNAALFRSGDLNGDWSESFSEHDARCAGKIEQLGLLAGYHQLNGDASFSVAFFGFVGNDAPTTLESATTSWLRDCRGQPTSEGYTLYETGRITANGLDSAPSSTFVTLYEDIFIVAEFSRATGEPSPRTVLPMVVERLEAALLLAPDDLPEAPQPWTPPQPDYTPLPGGCFAGPAWPGEFVDISPAWTDPDGPSAELFEVDVDVDGDGSPDRIVLHENGDLQVDLGDAGWTSLLTASTSYELAGRADLDGDGDDEVLLQRNGNNYGGIEVADLSGCTLQLALSTERDDTAFYGNWCSSASCAGILRRTDCILDDSGSFIRHHLLAVPDDQIDDWKSGLIDTAMWDYTVTDHRLIDGVMTTAVAQETTQLTETEAFATMGNPGLGADCRVR